MLKFAQNVPLSTLTTLQIGGPAGLFTVVHTQEELIEVVQYAKANLFPYLVIGGGSNLLINDSGVNCLIIKNEMEGITKVVRSLTVKSGTILQNLVDYSIAHGLSGLQKLTGIPGTVGGATFGNAGAYGQTISDYIREVKCLTKNGEIVTLDKEECEFGYRDSIFKKNGYTILEIWFKLDLLVSKDLRKEADEVLEKRLVKYPKGIKCPGSFFKNLVVDQQPKEILAKIPKEKITYDKISAGYLLESVGAQGQTLDGIEIASYHANLFVNKGGGTAKAFYDLAKKYAQKVREKFGITLEPEVQLINLPTLI
ncbi:MAG: UDP-N-acetylmuramate dehydrogenase [Patescibacteria group bacterium]